MDERKTSNFERKRYRQTYRAFGSRDRACEGDEDCCATGGGALEGGLVFKSASDDSDFFIAADWTGELGGIARVEG